jgi:hypothetical protein
MSDSLTGPSSDRVPSILELGGGAVTAGIFSMSARSPDGLDARYIEWHLLDHLPEQYRIEGIRHGARWVSTPACRRVRALRGGTLDAVDHVVNYLIAPPLRRSLDLAYDLMVALDDVGRMPSFRPPHVQAGVYALTGKAADPRAVAGADVLPWRPARGIYLLVERVLDESGVDRSAEVESLVELSGVAGVWSYAGGVVDRSPERVESPSSLRIAVCYLDADPVDTAARIAPVLLSRWSVGGIEPLLAGPFEVVVPWEWDRSLP